MKLKYVGSTVARIRIPSVQDPKVEVQPGETIEVDGAMAQFLLTNHDYTGAFVPAKEEEEPKKRKYGRKFTQDLKKYEV